MMMWRSGNWTDSAEIADTLFAVLDDFKARSVKFRSLRDGIANGLVWELGGGDAPAMVIVVSAFGQFERGQLYERIKAGIGRRRLPRTRGRTSVICPRGWVLWRCCRCCPWLLPVVLAVSASIKVVSDLFFGRRCRRYWVWC